MLEFNYRIGDFMRFKEFTDPLSKDYDIKSSNGSDPVQSVSDSNVYSEQLINMIGFLEDEEWLGYGLSLEEYLHPTKETIVKVEKYLIEHNQEPVVGKGMGL